MESKYHVPLPHLVKTSKPNSIPMSDYRLQYILFIQLIIIVHITYVKDTTYIIYIMLDAKYIIILHTVYYKS